MYLSTSNTYSSIRGLPLVHRGDLYRNKYSTIVQLSDISSHHQPISNDVAGLIAVAVEHF